MTHQTPGTGICSPAPASARAGRPWASSAGSDALCSPHPLHGVKLYSRPHRLDTCILRVHLTERIAFPGESSYTHGAGSWSRTASWRRWPSPGRLGIHDDVTDAGVAKPFFADLHALSEPEYGVEREGGAEEAVEDEDAIGDSVPAARRRRARLHRRVA